MSDLDKPIWSDLDKTPNVGFYDVTLYEVGRHF